MIDLNEMKSKNEKEVVISLEEFEKLNKTHLGYTIEIYIDNIDENLIKEIQNIIKNKYEMKIIENIEIEND